MVLKCEYERVFRYLKGILHDAFQRVSQRDGRNKRHLVCDEGLAILTIEDVDCNMSMMLSIQVALTHVPAIARLCVKRLCSLQWSRFLASEDQ